MLTHPLIVQEENVTDGQRDNDSIEVTPNVVYRRGVDDNIKMETNVLYEQRRHKSPASLKNSAIYEYID